MLPRQAVMRMLTATLLAVGLLLAEAGLLLDRRSESQAQEPKRFFYKIVDVNADTVTMQNTLNEYGSAGWELVAAEMGNMTAPRLIFKK